VPALVVLFVAAGLTPAGAAASTAGQAPPGTTGETVQPPPSPGLAAAAQKPRADFDGDGDSDVSIFRPSNGTWYLRTATPQAVAWGQSGDVPVPGDYDGNGTTDVAIYRPGNGTWYLRTPTPQAVPWGGQAGDIPVPGDYDGNGSTDVAIFRPGAGTWYLRTPTPQAVPWGGVAGDIPVQADYDGNGTTDVAIYRPGNGTWYLRTPTAQAVVWGGNAGDIPVPGDYDDDGDSDVAIYRPATGTWYLRTGVAQAIPWGGEAGDIPVPGDYDGNGSTDVAIFRPVAGAWYLRTATPQAVVWGGPGDIPLLAATAVSGFTISRPEIATRWQQLGGETGVLGRLTSHTTPTTCRGGEYNAFENGAITWRSDVGAHATYGPIRDKWAATGYECGPLGLPTEDQRPTTHKPGTVQVFQEGYIYSSSVGTYEVHGAIRAKYDSLGNEGSVLGFPTSDETATTCRSGRFNTFEGGAIYWRSDLGAQVVTGDIRAKWAALGAECSYLGLPITDEFATFGFAPAAGRNSRIQYFEGSEIVKNTTSGVIVARGEGGGASGFYENPDRSQLYMVRADRAIDFDWGTGSPDARVPADNWRAQWRTRLWVPESGNYTFYTVSDDGVQLGVCPSTRGLPCADDAGSEPLIIDNWTVHGATEDTSAPIFLARGSHALSLFYFEATGFSSIKLMWSGPGIPKQVIPRANIDPTLVGPPPPSGAAAEPLASEPAGAPVPH
jgi:hypothetical protein